MTNIKFGRFLLLLPALLTGCGDDDSAGGGSSSGNPGCPQLDVSACTVHLAPSASDTKTLQSALISASSGDTVCLCPGTFSLEREISLGVPNVTLRGLGQNVADVVLDFAAQTEGDDGFTVTSDGFTIENLSLKNTPGNGIVVTGAEDVTFRKLKVSWDAGSVTANGAYAVYPVKSKRVIVEDSEVVGAADAGIYVGQCEQAIVRRNKVHGNVAGIEIENTTDAEVYDNEATDNTAGILVFTLPNLEKKDGKHAKVHDNVIKANNRANFAEEGTIVASVPPGTGVLVLAADDTEIVNNGIEGNNSVGVLVVSMTTLDILLATTPDPGTDPDPEGTFVHGNTFSGNGQDPQGILAQYNVKPLEDVIWDGVEKAGATDSLCLGDPPLPTFRNMHAPAGVLSAAAHTTDATPHACKLPELPGVSW